MELVPLKVKIGLRPNGHADHPDWSKLPLAQAGGDPAQHMVVSWRYDKTSGHQEETVDSPRGMQWGMILVSAQFAQEALATFPALVTVMTEVEARDFWENKAHAHLPENKIDRDELVGLQAELALRKARGATAEVIAAVEARIDRALDPMDSSPGVRKTREKTWADAKTRLGFTIR